MDRQKILFPLPADSGWLFDIKRCALHDGPGIRTTFFFQGCPLNCPWCHNPESRSAPPGAPEMTAEKYTVSEVISQAEKDVLFFDQSGGGVTFSGGEPLCQPAFLQSLLDTCRERELHTAVDTCGYGDPLQVPALLSRADLVLYDIKAVNDRLHKQITGVSNAAILHNLDELIRHRTRLWLRFPLIPGYTDTRENIQDLKKLILEKQKHIEKISVLPFHRTAEHKYRKLQMRYLLKNTPAADDGHTAAVCEELARCHPHVQSGG